MAHDKQRHVAAGEYNPQAVIRPDMGGDRELHKGQNGGVARHKRFGVADHVAMLESRRVEWWGVVNWPTSCKPPSSFRRDFVSYSGRWSALSAV